MTVRLFHRLELCFWGTCLSEMVMLELAHRSCVVIFSNYKSWARQVVTVAEFPLRHTCQDILMTIEELQYKCLRGVPSRDDFTGIALRSRAEMCLRIGRDVF